ncbi:MAG: hypothetical protein M3394_02760, partial [Actinomycetota bacterium]|nr:hypothetical protein [Actinomycetota bacterium]
MTAAAGGSVPLGQPRRAHMEAAHGGPRWARPAHRADAQSAGEPPRSDPGAFKGPLVFALLVTALTWVVFGVLHAGGYGATEAMGSVNDILDTSTTVLAVVVGGLVLLRWRLVGER